MHTAFTPPSHTITLNKQIYSFQLSPYDYSANLFCAALKNKLILGLIRFPEESDTDDFEWEKLRELNQSIRCHAIAFSPETTLSMLPKQVTFCTAGADYLVRIYRHNLVDTDTVQEVNRHTSYINDVAWEINSGKYLASVSDDHSCQIRCQQDNFKSEIVFRLKSAGVAVRWHPEHEEKLLVAEKRGTIHMYNVESRQITISIDSTKVPLLDVDWCWKNQLLVSTLVGGEVAIFDLRCPYRPTETKILHEECGLQLKYSPTDKNILATITHPNLTLIVTHLRSELPLLLSSLKLFGGLAWHSRLPYICAADDNKLCFWKIFPK